MTQAQQFLEKWVKETYPNKLKSEIEIIDLSFRGLEGDLKLSEYPNLKLLACQFNYLNKIDLRKNSKLISLTCDDKETEIEELEKEITNRQSAIKEKETSLELNEEQKQLLDELIKETIDSTKYKKEALGSDDYGERREIFEETCWEIKKRLNTNLPREEKNKVYFILTNYEEIIENQFKLEQKLNKQTKIILPEFSEKGVVITTKMRSKMAFDSKESVIELFWKWVSEYNDYNEACQSIDRQCKKSEKVHYIPKSQILASIEINTNNFGGGN